MEKEITKKETYLAGTKKKAEENKSDTSVASKYDKKYFESRRCELQEMWKFPQNRFNFEL